MNFLLLLKDILIYPFDSTKDDNRFHHLLTFLFKEYPAFLWEKPSVWRVVLFPFLLLRQMFGEPTVGMIEES